MSIQLKVSSKIKNLGKEKTNQKSTNSKYHFKLLTSFGCDTSGKIKDCINFVTKNNYIVYAVGNNVIIRELSFNDNDKDTLASISHLSKQNNIFIHQLSPNSKRITSLNVSQDKNLLIITEELEDNNKNLFSTISIYFLAKFRVLNEKKIEPVRQIITDQFLNINSLSLAKDNDYLCGI